ncbi:MAG TPA: peptidoglycan-associated lipoprotein Pal [Candidatus Deferrimicrobiaceae bacterium]|jgi:peptidoglycan-associated lipoprotein
MRVHNRIHLLFAVLLIAGLAISGCAKRQLTRGESDRLETLANRIAQAESAGAKECAPKELAVAKVALEHAQHESGERFEVFNESLLETEKAVEALMEKMKGCKPASSQTMAPPSGTGDQGKNESPTSTPAATTPGAPGTPETAPPSTPPVPPGNASQPAPFRPAPVPAIQKEEGSFENIHFDFDESVIREDAKPILLVIASYMKNHPNAKLLVEGHCDERGTSEYNLALGQRRANATRDYLVNLGLAPGRLTTVSFGKERPLVQGHDDTAWALNRRAVFVLTP